MKVRKKGGGALFQEVKKGTWFDIMTKRGGGGCFLECGGLLGRGCFIQGNTIL